MQRSHRVAALAVFGFLTMQSAPAVADEYIQIGLGFDYSDGDYGDIEDTEIIAAPLSVKYIDEDFFVRASLPYLRIKGPGGVIPGDGGVIGPGGDTVTTEKGIGDLTLAAGYSIPLAWSTWLDFTGKVKVPTGSRSKGLSTGTTDFTAEAEIMHVFGAASASVRAGRRFNGSSTLYPLDDVWLAGASVYYQTGKLTLGLDYDWREGSLPTSQDRHEITGSATYKLSPAFLLQGYAYTGFNNASPDAGAGVQLLYRFGL
jgi:hypothetical protein